MKSAVKIPWDSRVLWVPMAWVTPLSLIYTITLQFIEANERLSEVKGW